MELAEWHLWRKRTGARGLRGLLMEQWDPSYDERESDVAGRIVAWYEGATHRD